jgi:phenylacetate-CoA ligase
MAEHYDTLETRDPEARECALMAALPSLLARAKERAPYFAELLRGVKPADIVDRRALVDLPVTRKSALIELQRKSPPFGGLTAVKPGALARIFSSPGPIYDAEGRAPDYWRVARALFAAGFRRGDIIHNSFSYHLTPAGSMLETGAAALGCAVVPAGIGQTELQLRTIADVRPDGYVGTPSFLRILIDKAKELGTDTSSMKKALVSGEAFPPAVQKDVAAAGIAGFQCYASADLGLIAYESEAREGLILAEGIVVELVHPGTGEIVAPGEIGEVVVTTLAEDYPLIRFATGDLSAELPGASPCGRTNRRIKGWLGRADQTTKVKGLFVHPTQIAEVARRHTAIIAARLVVDADERGADVMTLHVEMSEKAESEEAIAETLQSVTKLRGRVVVATPGTLPKDGKVIEDKRKIG